MANKKENNIHPTIFEEKEVRRVWRNEKWYFSVSDVVQALTDSGNVKQYIKKIRARDVELSVNWGTICTPVDITSKDGKKHKENVSDIEGIFRIIQSIPSPKAEPFKRWLAKVGKERIDEIADPELAITRAKEIYDKKGYPKDWVDKRMRGIAVRNSLTDEWKERGTSRGFEFAILTDEIYEAAFDKTAKEYMKHKGLDKRAGDNLRDHMGDIELILTMLGEATTTEMSTEKDSHGLEALKKDARVGGGVAGRTRKDIEQQTGKKVISSGNFKNKKFLNGSDKKHH
jgi:prophage antirepressor-like protein